MHLSATKPRLAAGDEGSSRSPAARPQLLSQIPGSVINSPGFITGAIVLEFLYALVMFAVMSGQKRDDLAPEPEPEPVAFLPAPKVEAADASKKGTPPPIPSASKTPAKPEEKTAAAPPAMPAPDAKTAVALASTTPAPAAPSPTAAKPEPAASKAEPPKPKPAVAAATPAPVTIPTIVPLGPLIDPLNDCKVQPGGNGLTILIPPTLHVFDPDRGIANSPRAVVDVAGDFVVQVMVPGSIKPGTKTLEGLPFTFQGAGLLLWQDVENYVRLERTASYLGDRGSSSQVLLESRKDGKPGRGVMLAIRDIDIALRMERHGVDINCTYTIDGKTWLPVKKSSLPFAAKVGVGISASNAAARPFPARFESFRLTRGLERSG